MWITCVLLVSMVSGQAPWSGNMHPSIGFPPGCDLTVSNDCAPSYEALASAGALWPCPAGNASAVTCGAAGCVEGTGDNPLCDGLSESSPCCCPKKGCAAEPRFGTVIGVCKGASCACGSTKTRAPSCAPQNRSGQCDTKCTGASVPCCFGQDVTPLVPFYEEGTHAVINYLAAYEFDVAAGVWTLAADSSFNTDARFPACDLMQPYCGQANRSQAWLAPQPGGAVFWGLGYYAAGVRGVGGEAGAMFVMSTEDWWAGTWYMLNQLALDRGPGAAYPADKCPGGVNDNCWASGNSGEMDFLETPWNKPSSAALNYTQSYSTQNNQVGRCFVGGDDSGGFGSQNFLLTEASPVGGGVPAEPIVYVAVVDRIGNWVYRIPASRVGDVWPGLGRSAANATVQAAPSALVGSVNPGVTPYAMTFTPNCQASNYTAALQQNCIFNGQQGFCGNWMRGFADSGQPLFPNASCARDVRGGVAMPWCACMVGKGGC